ncbi:MAG: HD domain-containing protein [Clostridium sp.]|jgi:HD superfamily phosphodiesterase|nr:HD domain-containing protein [Clostridium sp.]
MERIRLILAHELFRTALSRIREAEEDRRFCGHGMGHLLDVARIARIMNVEEAYHVEPERIYAAALLHDIGRSVEYMDGTPHERASADMAGKILTDCGFARGETELILRSIRSHRNAEVSQEKDLRGLLYRADKASRACYVCAAQTECRWKKKNTVLEY